MQYTICRKFSSLSILNDFACTRGVVAAKVTSPSCGVYSTLALKGLMRMQKNEANTKELVFVITITILNKK